MGPERPGAARQPGGTPRWLLGWQASFLLGLSTVIVGLVVSFRPVQSLAGIVVLLGTLMIISGIFHMARALDGAEAERVWRAIASVAFFATGIILIRHLHLSLALAGLIIGLAWVIQGVCALLDGVSGRRRAEAGWSVFFGAASLAAGIVVLAVPIASVSALAALMGAWFVVMGVLEMLGALVFRRTVLSRRARRASVPGQRVGASAPGESPAAGRPRADRPQYSPDSGLSSRGGAHHE